MKDNINMNLEDIDYENLEERLCLELEERMELGCWAYCDPFCLGYS